MALVLLGDGAGVARGYRLARSSGVLVDRQGIDAGVRY